MPREFILQLMQLRVETTMAMDLPLPRNTPFFLHTATIHCAILQSTCPWDMEDRLVLERSFYERLYLPGTLSMTCQ